MTLKESFKTISFMLIITIFFISILSFIYLTTEERIKDNEENVLRKAVLYSAGYNIENYNSKQIGELFDKNIKTIKNKGNEQFTYYISSNGDYIFLVHGNGLWGEIDAIIALKNDFKTISGVEFIKQNETPGLGARISEFWFKEQFRSKIIPLEMVKEGESGDSTHFEAITGATATSNAVLKMFDNELQILIKNLVE